MTNRTVRIFAVALVALAGVATYHAVGGADARDAEERLSTLEAHVQIEQLLMRYAAALNTGDADAYVATFTPDAVFELKRHASEPPFLGPFRGHDALRKQWFPESSTETASSGARGFGPMRHVTTNYEINVDGDTATVRAFFMEVVSNGANSPPGSKPPTIHAMGRYEDELVKRDGQWLFSKRTVVTDMNTKWEG